MFRKYFGDAKIFYRVFPVENIKWDRVKISQDCKVVQIKYKNYRIDTGQGNDFCYRNFVTDGTFYNISQDVLYLKVMEGVVKRVLEGQTALVMGFGQTGSGKSMTITGLHSFYQDRGILPRVIEEIFDLKNHLPSNMDVEVCITYFEVSSKNQALDLLKPYPTVIDKFNMKKLSKIRVFNDVQALRLIFIAEAIKEHNHSNKEYKSHIGSSVCTFHFSVKNMDLMEPYELTSQLHVVELAGNDVPKGNNFVEPIATANYIKSVIEYFIILITGKDQELLRIKARANFVSQYLAPCLNRNTVMRFIGHLMTEETSLPITMSMLKFGQMVKNLKPKVTTVALKDNEEMRVNVMEARLDELLKERTIKEMVEKKEQQLASREYFNRMQKTVEAFIGDEIDDVQMLDVTDIRSVLQIFKTLIVTSNEKKDELQKIVNEYLEQITVIPEEVDHSSDEILESKLHKKELLKETRSKKSLSSPKRIKPTDSKASPRKLKSDANSIKLTKSISISKRKPLDSVTSNNRLLDSLTTLTSILIDVIPEYKTAIKDYALSDTTSYKEDIERFKNNDNEMREICRNYLKEVDVLNDKFDMLSLRRYELIQMAMIEQIQKSNHCMEPEETQTVWAHNVEVAENEVVKQQEVVLHLQAELKILLELRRKLQNELKEKFEEFCKHKFGLPIPKLDDTEEVIMEDMESNGLYEHVELDESDYTRKMYNELFEKFKKLMRYEVKKKENFLKKSIKWTTDTLLINGHCWLFK